MKYIFKKIYKKDFIKNKKNKKKQDYELNNFIILHLILGIFIKNGKKSFSYYFLDNILFFLKKKSVKKPLIELRFRLNIISPAILLFNSRRGTVVHELPRVLTLKQSLKTSLTWIVKLMKKRKTNTLNNILKELESIRRNKGEILQKKKQIIFTAKKNKPFFYILNRRKIKLSFKENVRKTT